MLWQTTQLCWAKHLCMVASPRGPHKLPSAASNFLKFFPPCDPWVVNKSYRDGWFWNHPQRGRAQVITRTKGWGGFHWAASVLLTPCSLESCPPHESRPPVFHGMPWTHGSVNDYLCVSTDVCIADIISFHGFTFLAEKRQWLRMWSFSDGSVDFMRALGQLKS